MEKKSYPIRAEDYLLFEPIGQGVSASVHRAHCIPLDEIVAIKILDFERHNSDLSNISREAQTMILIDHPNVLKAHCSFVNDHNLWVVMPYMAGGSCLHIMKSVYPDGFEEVVIATILREVLKGLEYLHHHGRIHRDVKAGNILVDSKGGIKLGDFGVSACLFDSGDRQRSRNTFVGTPCWMAPEVMEQLHGYDFKADIWSFGITALELAHGHAPFSKYPPMKVLLMTLQNAPPGLDYERDKKFSRSFKQMIAMCLVKDPSKRPTAQKLLKQPFFKQARSQDYIVRKILEGLPTLGDRHQAIKEKEEDMLAQKKIPDGKKEEISQSWAHPREIMMEVFKALQELNVCWKKIGHNNIKCRRLPGYASHSGDMLNNHMHANPNLGDESAIVESDDATRKSSNVVKFEVQNEYKRGISGWNFDIEDLKSQASLIPDNDENLLGKDQSGCSNSLFDLDTVQERISEQASSAASCSSKDDNDMESDRMDFKSFGLLSPDQNTRYQRTMSNGSDHDSKAVGANNHNIMQNGVQFHGNTMENGCSGNRELEIGEKNVDAMAAQPSYERRIVMNSSSSDITIPSHERRSSLSSCTSDVLTSSKGESLKQQNQHQNMGNCDGDVSHSQIEMAAEALLKASKSSESITDDIDDKSKPPVVQQKGRFKVTSEKVDLEKSLSSIGLQKSHSMQVISQLPSPTVPSPSDATPNFSSLFQQMLGILQTSMLQRDYALSAIRQLCIGEQSANRAADAQSISASTVSLLEATHEREKELLQEVTDLQWRILCKDDEMQKLKAKLAQANIT